MGVDVWHDPSQQAHRRELGAAADWECLCVCVCVCLSGKWRRETELKSAQQQQQQQNFKFSIWVLISLSVWRLALCETPLDICCWVTKSSLDLSYLHLPFSLPPYHIPLLDLLALCWCPCAPSRPLFPHSCLSWRCIQVGKVIYRMLYHCMYFLFLLFPLFKNVGCCLTCVCITPLLFNFSSSWCRHIHIHTQNQTPTPLSIHSLSSLGPLLCHQLLISTHKAPSV